VIATIETLQSDIAPGQPVSTEATTVRLQYHHRTKQGSHLKLLYPKI